MFPASQSPRINSLLLLTQLRTLMESMESGCLPTTASRLRIQASIQLDPPFPIRGYPPALVLSIHPCRLPTTARRLRRLQTATRRIKSSMFLATMRTPPPTRRPTTLKLKLRRRPVSRNLTSHQQRRSSRTGRHCPLGQRSQTPPGHQSNLLRRARPK